MEYLIPTGQIYKICSNHPEITDIYVGSTEQKLGARMASHRYKYKRYLKNLSTNTSIFESFTKHGVDKFHIELIENFPCNTKTELKSRENHFIRELQCVNKYRAYTPPEVKKKEGVERAKQYRLLNKESIREKKKQEYQDNKEKHKEKSKKYRTEHDEEAKKKVSCSCGCIVAKRQLTEHYKTKKHLNFQN